MSYILSRNIRIEEDLIDQLFNSSKKRLARTLLLLARYGKESQPQKMLPQVSPGDAGGNDWHNALASEFFHEQIQETRLHSLQWRTSGPQFSPKRSPARLGTNFRAYRKAAYFHITAGNRAYQRIADSWPEGDLSTPRIAGNSFRLNRLSRGKLPVYVWF